MGERKLKRGRWHVLALVYTLVTVAVWNVAGFVALARATAEGGPPVAMLYIVPFLVPALFMSFSWFAFPFNYSVFGPWVPTAAPDEMPLLVRRSSWGRVAWLHASVPFFSWDVYPSCLGVRIIGVGAAFVPAESIARVRQRSRWGWSGWLVEHDCLEIRSPLTVPDREIAEKIREVVVGCCGRDPGLPGAP